MKKITAMIKKFFVATFLLFVTLIAMNILLYIIFFFNNVQHYQKNEPVKTLEKTSNALINKYGEYSLDREIEDELEKSNIWGILIENQTGNVIWSFQVPKEVPNYFTLTEISQFSKYYLKDYPVFTWEHSDGLLVLGYPKDSYTKMNNDYPITAIKEIPYFIFLIFFIDLSIVFLLYYLITRRTNRYITPVVEGISLLSKGKEVRLEKKDPFSDIIESINQTSIILQQKNESLKLKERNREKWIEGVSHDIRTPLSLILGYSEKLKNSEFTSKTDKQRAAVIVDQSIIIKELIDNLNLVSHLESNGLNTTLTSIYPLKILRQIITEILNRNQDELYKIHFHVEEVSDEFVVEGNEHLFKRAISNIILNSMKHNPTGCDIYITMIKKENTLEIIIKDTGKGLSSEEFKELKRFFEVTQQDISQNRKGLGLLIVKEILAIHNAKVLINLPKDGGVKFILSFPISTK